MSYSASILFAKTYSIDLDRWHFFFILSGNAIVTVDVEEGGERRIAELGPGDYLGELALLKDNVSQLRCCLLAVQLTAE